MADETPIPRKELEAWRKKAVDTLRVCYRDSVTAEKADQTLRLIREVERLREALRGVIAEADRETVAFIKARALLPEDDDAPRE